MKKLQNTLYVTTDNAYLSLEGETIVVLNDDEVIGKVPLLNLENIVSFGYRGVSPALMGACMYRDIGICFLTRNGKFLARVSGNVSGNVLLRTKQYKLADDTKGLEIAKLFIKGKIYNSKCFLERTVRDHSERIDNSIMSSSISQIKNSLLSIDSAESSNELIGIEGNAAKAYFAAFPQCILRNTEDFPFDERNRRPPLDPVNAMLSFIYTLLGNEIACALESVGLDPAAGFLHTLRPGRKSLALDMLEELRSPIADRFVISQINLGKVTSKDFEYKENGACYLKDNSRYEFIKSWQSRKNEVITHPFLDEKIEWGLVPYTQAMLLARYLRDDLDVYPPFMWK